MKLLPIFLLLSVLLLLQFGIAQNQKAELRATSPTFELVDGHFADGCVYQPIHRDMNTRVAPPKQFLAGKSQTANFQVNYSGFSPAAQAAFQFAIDIWASSIVSAWPIYVDASWESLEPNTLGAAGPGTLALINNQSLMVVALAEAIFEENLNAPGEADLIARFNSDLGSWYLGTDGQTPFGQFDFVTVVLHELGHGLGFFGTMNVDGGQGEWGLGSGFPMAFDRLAENGAGQQLIDTDIFPNPSSTLAQQLQSDNLFFTGFSAIEANGGARPPLYAPNPWESGSSFAHLDDSSFPSGDINSLMTPAFGTAEAIHAPGPIVLGIFDDIGWEVSTGGQVGIRWEETFSATTPPTGWLTIDRDGDGETFNYAQQLQNQAGQVVVTPESGTRFWESDFNSANGMLIDDWLITPRLPTIQNGDVLKFYAGAVGPDFPDSLKVWVSDTDNNIGSFTDQIAHFQLDGPLGNWTEYTFNLSEYEDEDIYIGINYYHTEGGPNGTSSNAMWIDHFKLEGVIVSGIEDDAAPGVVTDFSLAQNYPNPFNPTTNIRYSIPKSANVRLSVFNLLGQEVATLVNQQQTAGSHTIEFDGRNLTSGIYFYQIEAGEFRQVRKMLLAR